MTDPASSLPQGRLELLKTELAHRLLGSTIPARVAYLGSDATPRIFSTWFQWTGDALVMPTFISAPHVRHPASRLGDLRAHPEVAVTAGRRTGARGEILMEWLGARDRPLPFCALRTLEARRERARHRA